MKLLFILVVLLYALQGCAQKQDTIYTARDARLIPDMLGTKSALVKGDWQISFYNGNTVVIKDVQHTIVDTFYVHTRNSHDQMENIVIDIYNAFKSNLPQPYMISTRKESGQLVSVGLSQGKSMILFYIHQKPKE